MKRVQTIQIPIEELALPKMAYTVEEAAVVLNIGRTLAYALAAKGRLRTIHLGRKILVPVTEIQAFLDREIGRTPEV